MNSRKKESSSAHNHYPWDDGALNPLRALTAPMIGAQKTIKVECGKRVPLSAANVSARVTCPACVQKLLAHADLIERASLHIGKGAALDTMLADKVRLRRLVLGECSGGNSK